MATATATTSAGEPPRWRPSANPDPLRAASLPFEPGDAELALPGEWKLTFQASYFNLWNRTWHTSAVHRELGRVGLELSPEEFRLLESRYPHEGLYFVDLEGWRGDMLLSYGVSEGVSLFGRVPWIEIGRPHWDEIAESWHSALGLPSGDRELFPRGGSLFYFDAEGGTVERRDLDESGLADLSLGVSLDGGRWAGADHRLVVAVEAPTGDRDGLHGSGGWDTGVRWFSRWRWRAVDICAGAGWTHLSRKGSLLGLKRADPWHLLFGIDWRIGPGLVVFAQIFLERSLMAEAGTGQVTEPAQFRRYGIAADLKAGTWLGFDVGQDSLDVGIAPDYSFHLTIGSSF